MARVSVEDAVLEDEETAAERRRSDRAELVVRVDYSTIDELFSEFTRDINEGGLFIETEKPKPVGTVVTMYLNLPGTTDRFSTIGRIVRISGATETTPPGVGIEFDELTAEDRVKINSLIRALRNGDPTDAS
jgi:type IV pilus assembly protein PilZ